ncbi:MAG: M28 family peptidase [Bacteroides sp.]|nr:M28 family peptidase [Bacteroides sp.]MCM1379275.1 M28 family peptidase [Bacteroides sp.]MCM1445067.1 M28 family peptidase [Prevotella sp.]
MNAKLLIVGLALGVASCGCSKSATTSEQHAEAQIVEVPEFSADSAYANVAAQVAFGPRVGRSSAHELCAAWLTQELRRQGCDTLILQHTDLADFGPITNILGRFNLENKQRILLLAHWDSRPTADQDPDPANQSKAIDGANDGASGTGVLLEIARLIGSQIPEIGVDILFVDAEDAGTGSDDDSWARGTQYFAQNLPDRLPEYAILLDMVGGKGAKFPREMISEVNCKALNAKVWNAAKRLGLADRFPDRVGGAVNDDHVPLLRAGIPAIDIIETDHPQTGSFNPTWHTLNDNLDNIDRETLGDVGRLLTHIIYNEK